MGDSSKPAIGATYLFDQWNSIPECESRRYRAAIAGNNLWPMNRANKLSGVPQKLARVSMGRMVLHLACACRDGQVQWHWEGIKRELPKLNEADRDE